MVLKVILRLSWICLLLCSSGFSYPFPTSVQTGTGGGSTGGGDSVLGTYYGGGPSFFYGTGGVGYGSTGEGGGSGGKGRGGSGTGTGSKGSDLDDSDTGTGFPLFQAFPWGHKFQVVPQIFNLNELTLPEFLDNPWDVNDVPLGSVDQPVVPPSSHIVQTSNGYQRARSVLAHSKYSPDVWDVLSVPSGEDDDFPAKGQ